MERPRLEMTYLIYPLVIALAIIVAVVSAASFTV